MQQITLRPHNEQQMRLIKQLAKTLAIEATVQKEQSTQETPRQNRKREFLEGLERSVEQMNAAL